MDNQIQKEVPDVIPSKEEFEAQQYDLQETINQQWLNGAVFPPNNAGLEICKGWALNRVKTQHAFALKMLSGDATVEERDTWPIQLQAAQDFKADRASDTQNAMLDALLLNGESKTALADRVISKDIAMQTLIGLTGGVKRKTEKAVEAAETPEAVEAVISGAAEQMQQAITQFKAAMAG